MTVEWKKGWLVVLLLAAQCVVMPAAAQRNVNAPNAEELAFQEAVDRRSPFGIGVVDQDPFGLKRIEALLSSKKISAEVSGAALTQAASYGDAELVDLLVEKGVDVNHRVADTGQTVLMLAAAGGFYTQCGNDPLVTSYRGNSRIVKRLLEAGARVNEQDAAGNTAVILAAQFGRSDSVKLLLEAGADVRLANEHGWTALIHAANSSAAYDPTNMTEIIKGLLAAGADVNAIDRQEKTALDYASRPAIKEMLISAGASKQ
jgi:ankyrin repeat protein